MGEKKAYEIRLIIWNTHEIPLPAGGDRIDITCSVMYDPYGWKSAEIVKDTDTHRNS